MKIFGIHIKIEFFLLSLVTMTTQENRIIVMTKLDLQAFYLSLVQ